MAEKFYGKYCENYASSVRHLTNNNCPRHSAELNKGKHAIVALSIMQKTLTSKKARSLCE